MCACKSPDKVDEPESDEHKNVLSASPNKEQQQSTGISKPNTAIKKQMKVVIGSLECILDELKSVVVDLRDVVVQIDDVTSQIEERTGITNVKSDHLDKYLDRRLSNDTTSQLPIRKPRGRNSLDSGLPDNTSLISSTKSYHKCNHLYRSQDEDSFPVFSSSERNRWSDNEVALPSSRTKDTSPHKSIVSASSKKQRRHSHSQCSHNSKPHTDSMHVIAAKAASDSERFINNRYEKIKYSRIGKKSKPRSNSTKTPKTVDSSLEYNSTTEADKNSRLSSKGVPSIASSDQYDFYERQLEQQLENIGENRSTDTSKLDYFSTVDGLTNNRKSYSDTLFTTLQGTKSRQFHTSGNTTANELDSSDEDGVKDDFREFVIKPSDTFRYKVNQIGMRKMTKVGSCKVVIEP